MGVELNPWMMQAIRNVQSGNTPYQRARELRKRAIVAGAQAGLMGIGGAISAGMSEDEPRPQAPDNSKVMAYEDRLNAAKQEVMDRAIANARTEQDPFRMHTESYMPETAKTLQDSISAAEAGVALPRGGYWNRRAFDDASQQADLIAHDMNVSKELMRTGDTITKNQRTGIGGSMRTWGGGQ